MIFTSPETKVIVLPDTEDRMIVSPLIWVWGRHSEGPPFRRIKTKLGLQIGLA